MTPDRTEAEMIAKLLTKAQRDVVLKIGASARRRAIDFSGSVAAAMRLPTARRGAITDRNISRDHGRRTAWYFLTPLGLAVRAAILSHPDNAKEGV